MPRSRLFATGLWLAVTAASTGMVWMATSIVAADVTDRPAAVLAPDDVADELESASPPATATTTTTPLEADVPTSTVPPAGPVPLPANPSPAAAAPSPRNPPPGATAPLPPPTSTTTAPEARPASPPTPRPAPRPTATYSTSGGVVRVACNGVFIELLSAIPNNGYAVNVVADGPGNVDVHFVRRGEDVSVKAVCFGQPIRYYDQGPPPRQGPGPS